MTVQRAASEAEASRLAKGLPCKLEHLSWALGSRIRSQDSSVCYPNTEEAEMGGSLRLASQLVSLVKEVSSSLSITDCVSKDKVDSRQGGHSTLTSDLHMYAHSQVYMHTHTHPSHIATHI